ncbi:McrB family protein [Bacillus thuringiensis]|uniref:McrB family protein n=1 Tax=Bacillus thuringiensis TaxID=1428 RepID=UPI0021D69206|nr:AAA family ATPase [Bacillus thuringiensis]MCU7666778.1 AAA family ATPase [Bacillus thuringiensis]
MYGAKRWDINIAGILANDGEVSTGRSSVIINQNDNLQFYIRIVSTPPESFPRQIRDVCCYEEELNNWGFYDDITKSHFDRKQALRDFLNRYILFFKVDLKKPSGGMEYHVARDVSIVKKSDSFAPGTFLEPIPIFSEETTERTKEVFEQQLQGKKYIGDHKQISKDDDVAPSMILWKHQPDKQEYTLYGSFEKYDYAHGGFRFYTSSDQVNSINLQTEYVMNSYVHEQVLFMESKLNDELQDLLKEHGEPIGGLETQDASKEQLLDDKPVEPVTPEEHSIGYRESEFMEAFQNECKRLGLYYDTKDLYNFHTAMKTGSLVILAGMSGTGKSKLVQCYANAVKLNKDQMLFVPVRPFWQDDADVIGYLDTLHNVYRPGDSGVMNILARANEYGEDLHIICFDEMNLARVEHYFSQFLSVLELEENKRILRLYNEEFSARIYNQNVFPPTLRIGSNVIFVGTVNLDESTFQFSDKVLDRANVITLNMQPYSNVLQMEEQRKQEPIIPKSEPFTFDEYETFKRKEREISLHENESKLLWDLHIELQNCSRNLGIGWRIVRQISNFLNNIPLNAPLSREESFDIQLVQRVLTKVRGSDEQFTELLGQYNSDTKQVENSKLLELLSTMPTSYEFKQTRKLIAEKAKELRLYGHTV